MSGGLMQTKVGTFTLNTATGNQAITGVGFQPQYVIVFSANCGAFDTFQPSLLTAIGDSANHGATCYWQDANGSSMQTSSGGSGTLFLGDSGQARANFVSLDSDGFTINLALAPSPGKQVSYFAMGGIEEVGTGWKKWFRFDTSIGEGGVIAGDADMWWCFSTYGSRLVDGNWEGTFFTGMDVGWASADLGNDKGIGTFQLHSDFSLQTNLRNDRSMANFDFFGQLTTLDDGWVMTLDAPVTGGLDGAVPWAMFDLADEGAGETAYVSSGAATQPTSPGTQSISCGFRPKGLWLATVADTNHTTTITTKGNFTFGVSDGTNNNVIYGGNNPGSPNDSNAYHASDRCLVMCDETDTLYASCSASFNEDGFDLEWDVADGTARDFVYIAFSDELGPPPVQVAAYQRMYGWRASIDDNALETVEVFTSPQGFTS